MGRSTFLLISEGYGVKIVLVLRHSYTYNILVKNTTTNIIETKLIGVYSSREHIKKVIKKMKDLPGYRNHSLDCFKIESCEIDSSYWEQGFETIFMKDGINRYDREKIY